MDPMKLTGYDPSKDLGAAMRLLGSVMDKTLRIAIQIDTQINILIGLSSALFVFAASRVGSGESRFLLPLVVAAAGAAILCLFAVHPPRFMRKHGQMESVLYAKRIASFETPQAYAAELSAVSVDRDRIFTEYACEVYNLVRFYYQPKRKLFHAARMVLLLGIATSLATFLASFYI
jgi:hypothetical protein